MSYKIAVASGKGGTGKTTVSINLYHHFNQNSTLVDCDVEEPNDAIFFNNLTTISKDVVTRLLPVIDNTKCTYCRKCVEHCEFNAIVVIPSVSFAEINSSLCHSCGACSWVCPENAITEHPDTIGEIIRYNGEPDDYITEGRLKIGSVLQTMLIKELKKQTMDDAEIIIYDAPPGTSCPVVQTITGVDYVVLVTEPTPFGLYDLQLTIDMLKEINKPFGIIVNKEGVGDNKVYEYIADQGFDLLGGIPFNRDYAAQYANGSLLENIPEEIKKAYKTIISNLENRIKNHA